MDEEAEEIVACIEAAFDTMKPGPLTLQQANQAKSNSQEQLDDWYRKPAVRNWQELADAEIESCGKAFYGADLQSWLAFVPAWMRWTLRNHRASDSFVSDQTIYTLDPNHHRGRFEYFDAEQKRAIYGFLFYMANEDDYADSEAARTAIEVYWGRFA